MVKDLCPNKGEQVILGLRACVRDQHTQLQTQAKKLTESMKESDELRAQCSELQKRCAALEARLQGDVASVPLPISRRIWLLARVRPMLGMEAMRHGTSPPALNLEAEHADGPAKLTLRRQDVAQAFAVEVEGLYYPSASQRSVWNQMKPLFDHAAQGTPVSVLMHGGAGSGKSHTLVGGGVEPCGLFQLTCEYFGAMGCAVYGRLCAIHDEKCIDLLSPEHVTVKSLEQLSSLFIGTSSMQHLATTAGKAWGSRTSSIVLQIEVREPASQTALGVVNFVEVAAEATIQQGCVADVLQAIKKEATVPYQACKLTSLLRAYLDTTAQVAVFLTLSPSPDDVEASARTIDFGSQL